ncbi:MAG: thioredoxin domain-containing protein [Anaerolineaceae bacterium]|nr:thioredoxin domain-containing protein [Anaerolineaceae bacterium]
MYYFILPFVFLLGFGLGFLVWGRGGVDNQAEAAQNNDEEALMRYDISVDDDPYIGPLDAPVTIIMFSDYQCYYCQKWYLEVFGLLMQTYEGQIRFVYRDFPLTGIHDSANAAAEAANCAGDQGKYWDYFNKVYSSTTQLNSTAIHNYASEISLDLEEFTQCLSSNKYTDEVKADLAYAIALGVQSTPTFFVN